MKKKLVFISLLIISVTSIITTVSIYRKNESSEDQRSTQFVLYPTDIKPNNIIWTDSETLLYSTQHTIYTYDPVNRTSTEIYHTENEILDMSETTNAYYVVEKSHQHSIAMSVSIDGSTQSTREFDNDAIVTTHRGYFCETSIYTISNPDELSSKTQIYQENKEEALRTYRFTQTLTPAWCAETPPFIPAVPFLLPDVYTLDNSSEAVPNFKGEINDEPIITMKFNPPAIGIQTTKSLHSFVYNPDTQSLQQKTSIENTDSITVWNITPSGEIVLLKEGTIYVHTPENPVTKIPLEKTIVTFTEILPHESFNTFALIDTSTNLYILQRQ